MSIQTGQGPKHTLVATLGGQAQIITCTLDLLLQRNTPIDEVFVIHPASSPDIQKSLTRLDAEFARDSYLFDGQRRTMRFRKQVLNRYGSNIEDIVDEHTANGTLDTIGELVRTLKQQQRIIHFSISAGRRLMAFLSFSAALLYFDTPDELLHLYTPESVKKRFDASGEMHLPPGNGQRLIEVPFARAAQPVLSSMLNLRPSVAIREDREEREKLKEQCCTQIVQMFKNKPRHYQVLQGIAQGLHPSEVATKLSIQQSTINTYTNAIYRECRNAWNVPEKTRIDYRFVYAEFADYDFS